MSNDNVKPSIRKRIGEFSILGLYLIIDAAEIWPRSHWLALVVALIGIVALLLLDGGFSTKRIIVISGAIAVAFTVIYFVAPESETPETEVIGTLQPGSDDDPPNTCERGNPSPPMPPDAWKIFVGNTVISIGKTNEIPLIAVGKCKVLTIHRDDSGLSINADLFDSEGRLIASIKNNQFHALSGQHSRVERGHDLTNVKVTDGSGREILFVRYLNRSAVRVRGIFGCPGHTLVPVKDNEPLPNIITGFSCIRAPEGMKIGWAFFAMDPPPSVK